MRRRFTVAIVGVVAAALVVTGVGTLLLLQAQSRRNTRRQLVQLGTNLAATARLSQAGSFSNLRVLLRRTQDLAIINIPPSAQVQLPKGMKRADLDIPQLSAGQTVSGLNGSVAFTVVPFRTGNRRQLFAVAVTQPAPKGGGAGLYFLLSAGVALLVAAGVAETLARRITHPLVTAQAATRRIADGDLTVRVPLPARAYPEVAGLADSINTMAATLERLRGGERQFLMSVSHDLRTPLTSIRGFAEALADGTATDTTRAANVIAAEARRLERLVRDLLDLAKLQTQSFSLDVRPTDLAEVVTDTAEGFVPAAEGLGLRILVAEPLTVGPSGPMEVSRRPWPMVVADPDRLAQVVANLVENAMKFATTGVKVAMWFQPAAHGAAIAQVTVDDDGPGIAAADLPHVFDRLWRSSPAATSGRQVGSGLGLAIVAELAAAMGGSITAESPAPRISPGTGQSDESAAPASTPGTRITVNLRLWPAASEFAASAAAGAAPTGGPAPAAGARGPGDGPAPAGAGTAPASGPAPAGDGPAPAGGAGPEVGPSPPVGAAPD